MASVRQLCDLLLLDEAVPQTAAGEISRRLPLMEKFQTNLRVRLVVTAQGIRKGRSATDRLEASEPQHGGVVLIPNFALQVLGFLWLGAKRKPARRVNSAPVIRFCDYTQPNRCVRQLASATTA